MSSSRNGKPSEVNFPDFSKEVLQKTSTDSGTSSSVEDWPVGALFTNENITRVMYSGTDDAKVLRSARLSEYGRPEASFIEKLMNGVSYLPSFSVSVPVYKTRAHIGLSGPIRALSERFRSNISVSPTVLTISGEGGVGKSYLRDSISRFLFAEDPHLLSGDRTVREGDLYSGQRLISNDEIEVDKSGSNRMKILKLLVSEARTECPTSSLEGKSKKWNHQIVVNLTNHGRHVHREMKKMGSERKLGLHVCMEPRKKCDSPSPAMRELFDGTNEEKGRFLEYAIKNQDILLFSEFFDSQYTFTMCNADGKTENLMSFYLIMSLLATAANPALCSKVNYGQIVKSSFQLRNHWSFSPEMSELIVLKNRSSSKDMAYVHNSYVDMDRVLTESEFKSFIVGLSHGSVARLPGVYRAQDWMGRETYAFSKTQSAIKFKDVVLALSKQSKLYDYTQEQVKFQNADGEIVTPFDLSVSDDDFTDSDCDSNPEMTMPNPENEEIHFQGRTYPTQGREKPFIQSFRGETYCFQHQNHLSLKLERRRADSQSPSIATSGPCEFRYTTDINIRRIGNTVWLCDHTREGHPLCVLILPKSVTPDQLFTDKFGSISLLDVTRSDAELIKLWNSELDLPNNIPSNWDMISALKVKDKQIEKLEKKVDSLQKEFALFSLYSKPSDIY